MYKLIRNFLFLFDAEFIHEFSVKSIRIFGKIPFFNLFIREVFHLKTDNLKVKLFGLEFKNPVGLAAGFDKNAEFYKEFSILGLVLLKLAL